ncbi:MAG: hypothetical protein D6808_02880 [Candidatus Dadabacteria bacterium]|nr:MAG: hypothetical protein D6808_02880 [Candidatus Dadabacteria bacterium]
MNLVQEMLQRWSYIVKQGKKDNTNYDKGPQIWLLIFADIVTLVLCFFIALAKIHGANGANKEAALKRSNGTYIAEYHGGNAVSAPPALFSRDEILAGKVGEALKAQLKNTMISNDYKVKGAVIETCSDAYQREPEKEWFFSVNYSLEVERQLFDAFGREISLKRRIVGPFCTVIKGIGQSSGYVASVRLIAERG